MGSGACRPSDTLPIVTTVDAPVVLGREAVRAAILESAAMLFAARGSAAVSLREVAAAAGVNYGLVHRHFGTKDALVRAVLRLEADELVAALESARRDGLAPASVLVGNDRFVRTFARAELDGLEIGARWAQRPNAARLVEYLAGSAEGSAAGPRAHEVRRAAVVTAALMLGWALFEPALARAAGLGVLDPREAARRLAAAGARLQA